MTYTITLSETDATHIAAVRKMAGQLERHGNSLDFCGSTIRVEPGDWTCVDCDDEISGSILLGIVNATLAQERGETDS